MISFNCTGCKQKLQVKDDLAGKKIKCPKCGQLAVVSSPILTVAGQSNVQADPPLTPHQSLSGQETVAPQQAGEPASSGETVSPQPDNSGPSRDAYDFLAPSQAADEIGRLGTYRVLKVLGQGAMGVVFLAEDPHLERKVAIKVMKPVLAASDSAKKRFLREAKTTASIKHDHIVSIYQVGEDRGVPFLAMEFLEGESLDDCIKREGTLPVGEVIRIGKEIAEGLAQAHQKGLIHRDIKPANIWLEGKKRRAKILDFGLARATEDESHLTQSGAIMGTPAYMAPEQARGEKVDHRCDLFSLGCVLYCLCTGVMPFKGKDSISTLMAVAMETPKSPAELQSGTPLAVSDLVMKLMAKEKSERFATAEEVVAELQRLEGMVQTKPGNPSTVSDTLALSSLQGSPAATSSTVSNQQPPRSKRTRPVLIALVLCGVLGLIILAGIIVRLQTSDGTLVVEVDQPDAMVQVLDAEGKVEVSQKGGIGKVTISVVPGKHKLRVERDGFVVYGADFEMEKGGVKTITARLEPLKLAVNDPAKKTPDPSKKAPSQPKDNLKYVTNDLGMKFVWIPPGTFMMGSPKEEEGRLDNETQHKVTLTKGFYMGVYTVTQEQWQEVMGNNPSRFKGEKNLPVDSVSGTDCQEFIKKLREKDKDKKAYRLPTEAEWEYACRAGTTTPFHFVETISTDQANYYGEVVYGNGKKGVYRKKTTPVGTFPANAWGLHDMHGNVLQWCQDWYAAEYPKNDVTDPQGPEKGEERVLRGGSWNFLPVYCRSAVRCWNGPGRRFVIYGCRLCFCLD